MAGTFYPSRKDLLQKTVDDLLGGAMKFDPLLEEGQKLVALIVPHAGYIYSGPIAATAYVHVRSIQERIETVVLAGPSHFVSMSGLAHPAADFYSTPLGVVEVDQGALGSINDLPQVRGNQEAHESEHSLEVQIPFLQRVLSSFTLLPLVVGHCSPEKVAQVIDRFLGKEKTLVLISSDLSHYLPYDEANLLDRDTSNSILKKTILVDSNRACGAAPINGLLLAAQKMKLKSKLLDLRNSGDTAGDRNRVVGYGAFAFYKDAT